VAEELVSVVGGTPPRMGNLADAKLAGLAGKESWKVGLSLAGFVRREAEGFNYFRTDFITLGANTNPTMHYDVRWRGCRFVGKYIHSPLQYPPSYPAPSGMKQRDRPDLRVDEIDRDAIGHRHIEHESGTRGRMPVHPFDLGPPGVAMFLPGHLGLVDLVAQHVGRKSRFGRTKPPPPAHHLADRLTGPEPQVERLVSLSPAGDPGNHAEALPPLGNLEPGDSPGNPVLLDAPGHGGTIEPRATLCSSRPSVGV
jgi:hypothetical protein